jgi:hypothetical protein
MIRHHRAGLIVTLMVGVWLSTLGAVAPVWGQEISEELKDSPQPSQRSAEIDAYIKAQFAKILGNDPALRTRAREHMTTDVLVVRNNQPAPPAFLDAYAARLNAAVLDTLKSNPSATARLNLAIIVAKVAERSSPSIRLQDAAMAMLNDEDLPVVLWGMKASRWLIPSLLRNGSVQNKLMPAVIPTIKKHGSPSLLVEQGYAAFSLGLPDPVYSKDVTAKMIEQVTPQMQELLKLRTEQYVVGKTLPEDALIDRTASAWLVLPQVWPAQTAKQREQSVQLISDLLGIATQRWVANQGERETLTVLIQWASKAIWVVADLQNNASLKNVVEPLTKLSVHDSPQGVQASSDAVFPALQEQFQNLQAPPKLNMAGGESGSQTAVAEGLN